MMTITKAIRSVNLNRRDRVTLLSGQEGEILELVDATLKTYRIRLIENKQIVYFDETKIKLKQKHILNLLLGR